MTAIVDYDTGNLRSVADAMRRIGAEFTITAYPALLRGADRVLLPGVGEASSAMAKLRERGLDLVIPTLTQPVLGICIGMQLLCLDSEEGDARCLGIFPAHVRRLKPAENGLKSAACAERCWKESTKRPTSITSTRMRRRSAKRRSPAPITAGSSAPRWAAATFSARSSTPKRAVRRAKGSCATF